jgi:hypothetical protein
VNLHRGRNLKTVFFRIDDFFEPPHSKQMNISKKHNGNEPYSPKQEALKTAYALKYTGLG